jgi:hypothetical protein
MSSRATPPSGHAIALYGRHSLARLALGSGGLTPRHQRPVLITTKRKAPSATGIVDVGHQAEPAVVAEDGDMRHDDRAPHEQVG